MSFQTDFNSNLEVLSLSFHRYHSETYTPSEVRFVLLVTTVIWNKPLKNGASKICGRQSF